MGSWSYPYSCLQVHRRANWMVAVKGHSRYIWNTETYAGCNLYGRYLNYGNLQILGAGNPISNFGSGYRQEGFDWAHIPGTTATVLPVDSLRARIENADTNAGFEEMLQSDESFCNGLSFSEQSVWGMKLHSHDKYDGSLRARKSVFCFDNRIICLGTNICSDYPASTETTLFQVAATPAILAENTHTTPLTDGYGNYYYALSDSLYTRIGLQYSRHEETDAPTEGYFSMAALSHGVRPHNAAYEYVISVQPKEAPSQETVAASYQVLRADSMAHIVTDTESGLAAYVLFEPNAAFGNSFPCLLFVQHTETGLTLRVSDPDLHLYEGASDETYDTGGSVKNALSTPIRGKMRLLSQVCSALPSPGIGRFVPHSRTILPIRWQRYPSLRSRATPPAYLSPAATAWGQHSNFYPYETPHYSLRLSIVPRCRPCGN